MTERLDRRHPLWTMDVAPMSDLRTAIIWRVHHCMADGMTTLRIGDALLWEGERQASAPDSPAAASAPATQAPSELVLAASWRGAVHDMAVLAATVRRELVPSGAVVPLDADIGSHRSVAWTRNSLEALHHAAKSIDPTVTLNDAVIGIVAAGVRHWLVSVTRPITALRVRIPVSLHRPHEDPLAGNRDSFIDVDVPMGDISVAERIHAISRQTAERKQRHDAEHLDRLFREVGMLPFGSHALAMTAGPHEFSLCVSNVPGPSRSLYVAGGELAELHSIVEIAPRHALRVSVISASGGISFGLCTDGDILDANLVAGGIDAAIAELLQWQPVHTQPHGADS
jgi:WS/DGAT/MGAT family acyltransferase